MMDDEEEKAAAEVTSGCQVRAEIFYEEARECTTARIAATYQVVAARWSQLARDRMFGEDA